MLRVLGSPKRMCDGVTRRDMLWAGGLGLFGLGLGDYLEAKATQPNNQAVQDRHFGRAKSCILLFLYGSPSQLETVDMKPDAPLEIRGDLKAIRSTLPGCDVCELMPNSARVMDKVTVVRSVNHPYPIHGVAYATTGIQQIDAPMELAPHDARHWPFIGSVVAYLNQAKRTGMPDNIALPWQFSSQRTGEVYRAGPYASFLGSAFNPHFTKFEGKANAKITKMLRDEYVEFLEPYVGVDPNMKFSLGSTGKPSPEITIDRLNQRKSLLAQFDDARSTFDGSAAAKQMTQQRQLAYEFIANPKIREALDVQLEPRALREKYGMTVFGQAALAARRLVEGGSKFVTVFWDEFGLAGSGWDTHWEHYPRMKNELMPGFDMAFSGLVDDLDQRGMLDETLVVVLSEHGRTPKMNNAKGGGRDHWSQAYSAMFAGGGTARGKVVGKTDSIGGTVKDRPVSPKDLLATIYHLLGIDLETHLVDRTQRPQIIVPDAQVIPEMLA